MTGAEGSGTGASTGAGSRPEVRSEVTGIAAESDANERDVEERRARIRGWLAARTPPAPALLAARLDVFVRTAPAVQLRGTMTDVLGALGLLALKASVARGETGDEVALDLLAADAFVTYAFEAASADGADVGLVAAGLLARTVP